MNTNAAALGLGAAGEGARRTAAGTAALPKTSGAVAGTRTVLQTMSNHNALLTRLLE